MFFLGKKGGQGDGGGRNRKTWGENVQHITYTLRKSKTKLRERDRKKKNSNSTKTAEIWRCVVVGAGGSALTAGKFKASLGYQRPHLTKQKPESAKWPRESSKPQT